MRLGWKGTIQSTHSAADASPQYTAFLLPWKHGPQDHLVGTVVEALLTDGEGLTRPVMLGHVCVRTYVCMYVCMYVCIYLRFFSIQVILNGFSSVTTPGRTDGLANRVVVLSTWGPQVGDIQPHPHTSYTHTLPLTPHTHTLPLHTPHLHTSPHAPPTHTPLLTPPTFTSTPMDSLAVKVEVSVFFPSLHKQTATSD